MPFPEYMTRQRRWMATRGGKLPISINPPPPNAPTNWSCSWANPETWSDYDAVAAFTNDMCFVMHGDWTGDRVICLDFDKCYVDGRLTVAVQAFLEKYPTFVEKSSSGSGLHAFYLYSGPKFKSRTQFQFPGCSLDILYSAQIRVTGTLAEMSRPLQRLGYEQINAWVKIDDGLDVDSSGIWEAPAEPLDDYLVEVMQGYESIEGQGGDNEIFRAACELARYGVTGHTATAYLQQVPADPPWTDDLIHHKVSSAYVSVCEVDEWDTHDVPDTSGDSFDDTNTNASQEIQPDSNKKAIGLNSLSWSQIKDVPTRPYLVDGLFIDKATLFIGGREKCFKTSIAADLALSLATQGKFLDTFHVLEPRRVLFISAENEVDEHREIMERIARQKGLDLTTTEDVFRLTTLIPEVSVNRRNEVVGGCLDQLDEELGHYGHEVVIFDPFYFMVSNVPLIDMLGVRVVLKSVRDLCKLHGAWPIFCHHANSRKSREEFLPMQLGDFYGSGVQQFARQWLLLSHAEEMVEGVAKLHINAGGSKGKKTPYRMTIDEGKDTDMTRREWCITVQEEVAYEIMKRGEQDILNHLQIEDLPATAADLRSKSGLNKRDCDIVLARMVRADKLRLEGNKYAIPDRLPD